MSLTRWASAFLLTQLVEVPIYAYALRGRWTAAFMASAITHSISVIPRTRRAAKA